MCNRLHKISHRWENVTLMSQNVQPVAQKMFTRINISKCPIDWTKCQLELAWHRCHVFVLQRCNKMSHRWDKQEINFPYPVTSMLQNEKSTSHFKVCHRWHKKMLNWFNISENVQPVGQKVKSTLLLKVWHRCHKCRCSCWSTCSGLYFRVKLLFLKVIDLYSNPILYVIMAYKISACNPLKYRKNYSSRSHFITLC